MPTVLPPQHLQHGVLGDPDHAEHGPVADSDPGALRGLEVDIVPQRAEALDELQVRRGLDQIGVDCADPLGDPIDGVGKMATQGLAVGRAQHGDLKQVGGGVDYRALVTEAAFRGKDSLVGQERVLWRPAVGHRWMAVKGSLPCIAALAHRTRTRPWRQPSRDLEALDADCTRSRRQGQGGLPEGGRQALQAA